MPTAARRVRQHLRRALDAEAPLAAQVCAANDVLAAALHANVVAWGTVDPATMLSTSCAVFGTFTTEHPLSSDELARERRLFELEWKDTDVNTFADMHRHGRIAAALRESVAGPLSSVTRYRDLLRPLGVVDELRLMCSADGLVWSTVIFYRTGEQLPFTSTDVQTAGAASKPLALAFREAMLHAALDASDLADPPGAVLLGADGTLLSTSFAAERLLSTVDERHVATTLRNVARRVEHVGSAIARISGADGVLWLHGSAAKGLDGSISVVVERPRRVELAPLIRVFRAHLGASKHSIQSLARRWIRLEVSQRRPPRAITWA